MIAFSNDLEIKGIKRFTYFGTAQVLYRGEDGVARVLDGYCPHLGAHLGGGRVEGDHVICAFHEWRFDSSGRCVEIPYCDHAIPAKAQVAPWPVLERNGMIFLWYHPDQAEPDFDVPFLPNHEADDWLPWAHSCIQIKTHSKEIVENVVDIAHFRPVHGTQIEKFENEFNDHMAVQRTSGVAYPRGGGTDKFDLVATYYGPGYQISDMDGVLQSLLVNAHTMIDENTLDLRFGVAIKPNPDVVAEEHHERFAQAYVDNLTTGFLEDVAIWENKLYRQHPVLCASDGPIMKLRKWYRQFYAD